jgi:hypothetical protein
VNFTPSVERKIDSAPQPTDGQPDRDLRRAIATAVAAAGPDPDVVIEAPMALLGRRRFE